MFNKKQREALASARVTAWQITAAEKAMQPQPKKLKKDFIRRIEEMLWLKGAACVTPKRVFSPEGWRAKQVAGKKVAAIRHAQGQVKARVDNAARSVHRTLAEISASLR